MPTTEMAIFRINRRIHDIAKQLSTSFTCLLTQELHMIFVETNSSSKQF